MELMYTPSEPEGNYLRTRERLQHVLQRLCELQENL